MIYRSSIARPSMSFPIKRQVPQKKKKKDTGFVRNKAIESLPRANDSFFRTRFVGTSRSMKSVVVKVIRGRPLATRISRVSRARYHSRCTRCVCVCLCRHNREGDETAAADQAVGEQGRRATGSHKHHAPVLGGNRRNEARLRRRARPLQEAESREVRSSERFPSVRFLS